MQNYFLVFIGAGIGGVLRYWGTYYIYKFLPPTFPYGTLLVNISGSFILGLVMFYFDSNELISSNVKVFLTIGICGGLTTFSAFSFETINLLREKEFLYAGINIVSNVFLSLLALFAAYKLSKLLSGV